MDKKEEKLIDSLIEQRKSLWTALLVLNTGLFGLILSSNFTDYNFALKFLLVLLGFYFDYTFTFALFQVNKRLNELIG